MASLACLTALAVAVSQIPHYHLTTMDDGSSERLQLTVELPGMSQHIHACFREGLASTW